MRDTVAPSIRVDLSFSEITICPLQVVRPGAPEVIGTVRTVRPSRTTRIVCKAAAMVET
ncbi:hypothetical protein ACWDE0_42655 [Streptomyces sp. 900105755]|uniref:hypothetical protein n=1 Tax=Streptomyces sp. Ag109_O5-10 TaxID=1855349 RepID=UPI00210DEA95|nr:hypothetical protein [Streptomyces sp. Ag109_O5-10]